MSQDACHIWKYYIIKCYKMPVIFTYNDRYHGNFYEYYIKMLFHWLTMVTHCFSTRKVYNRDFAQSTLQTCRSYRCHIPVIFIYNDRYHGHFYEYYIKMLFHRLAMVTDCFSTHKVYNRDFAQSTLQTCRSYRCHISVIFIYNDRYQGNFYEYYIMMLFHRLTMVTHCFSTHKVYNRAFAQSTLQTCRSYRCRHLPVCTQDYSGIWLDLHAVFHGTWQYHPSGSWDAHLHKVLNDNN